MFKPAFYIGMSLTLRKIKYEKLKMQYFKFKLVLIYLRVNEYDTF